MIEDRRRRKPQLLAKSRESSVPRLRFVGGMADRSYGPICRFVSGAGPAGRRILAAARDTSV